MFIALGCSTAVYHAGLTLSVRKQAHHRFINDDIKVGVACTEIFSDILFFSVRSIYYFYSFLT